MTVQWLTAFLDRPEPVAAASTAFWTGVTGSTVSPVRGERGRFATLLPPDGDPYLRTRTVLAGGGVHLDVHVADVDAAVRRAVAAGATARPEAGYAVLTSPAGLVWDLVPPLATADGGPRRPAPVTRPDGVRSLVDQLCLDIPPGPYTAECAFWQAVTGWELHQGSRPEFAYLARPEGMPLRLLLQRLDDAAPGAPAACHLDLASTDVDREVARHEAWGARQVARFPRWTTLVDPAGVPYCVTGRNPDTGTV